MSRRKPNGYKNDLSTAQRKILAVLSDGLPHTRQELHACLWDQNGPLSNVNQHISNIRKLLIPHGENIVCELVKRTIHYRHVKLLKSLGKD